MAPVILVITSVLMGVFAGTILEYSRKASAQLKNPDSYIETVMDESPLDGIDPSDYQPEAPDKSAGDHH
ncbi:MAG: hypothetical protein ABEK50_03630 [bacterium]